MGVELLKTGVQIRKCMIFSIILCYRSVCKHPFLVGMVLFLIFLYRSFPIVFSFLVSAFPVLVCTAVLLGTLLSFGHPNLPEIEEEEKTTHEIASLITGAPRDAVVVERDENHAVEWYTEKRRDVEEKSIEEASFTENEISLVKKDDNAINNVSLSGENSQEIQIEKEIVEETERALHDSGLEWNSGMNEDKRRDGEVFEDNHSQVHRAIHENLEREKDKAPGEFIYSQITDHLVSPPGSPWKLLEEGEEDEASDSGSDRTKSSSPGASMADIILMLDELHPLLDEDAPQPASVAHDDSDAASVQSPCSNGSDDDDAEEEEEEKETRREKEDAFKSAITWTEDDQKNLMDLGTSELERNQYLESLITKRKSRMMMTEKNLIDFDGADHPFNIPPISTGRQNPFDVPANSNELPIPGSASSILLPRRNPFDLPYDSNEEKPDLMEDSLQQEFIMFQSKEPFLRRHESFNVGPSLFGISKQGRQDIRLSPYFVPEQMASEGTNYSTFQRQSIELSDSKGSSIPETESVGSAEDLEDTKLMEEAISPESELIASIEHATEHVGHGTQFSEDVESVELVEVKSENMENHLEMESKLFRIESASNSMNLNANEIHLNSEAVEQKYSSRSSSSSLSGENEVFSSEKGNEGSSTLEVRRNNLIEEPSISARPSLEKSDFNITRELIDNAQHKVLVYDSSPPAIKKIKKALSSSISSDVQEIGFPLVLVKRGISFIERSSGVSDQSMEKDTPTNEQMLMDSLQLHAAGENELGLRGISETDKHDLNFRFSHISPNFNSAKSLTPESAVEHSSIDPMHSSETSGGENFLYKDESYCHSEVRLPSSSFVADIHAVIHEDVCEKVESMSSCPQSKPSEGYNVASAPGEHSHTHPDTSSFGSKSVEHVVEKEIAVHFILDQTHSSNSDANHVETDGELVYPRDLPLFEEKTIPRPEKQLPSSSEHMNESSTKNHEELQELFNVQGHSSNSANDSHDYVQIITEYADEIKEIDEQFLSEIDTVGDFSVKDLGMDEIEKFPVSGGESFLLPHDAEIVSDGAVEGATIDVHRTEVVISGENFSASRFEEEINKHEEMESGSELRMSGESLVKHVDSFPGEPVQKVVECPPDLKSINNELLPTKTETEHADYFAKQTLDAGESNPDIRVDEALTEDIESIPGAQSTKVETKVELHEPEILYRVQTEAETNIGIPVLEARALEDIDSAFKQISEKVIEKPVVLESINAKLAPEDTMAGPLKDGTLLEGSNLTEELPIVEARSIEDIDLAFKHLQENTVDGNVLPGSVSDHLNVIASNDRVESSSELNKVETSSSIDSRVDLKEVSGGNPEKMLHTDSQDGSVGLEVNNFSSSEDIKSSDKESGMHKTSTSAAEKPNHEVEASNASNKAELKADKSSSSSSSNSSDSDVE